MAGPPFVETHQSTQRTILERTVTEDFSPGIKLPWMATKMARGIWHARDSQTAHNGVGSKHPAGCVN